MSYFESRLLSKSLLVVTSLQTHRVSPSWTNNICGSAKFQLKLAAELKQKNASDSVDALYGDKQQSAKEQLTVEEIFHYERFLYNRIAFDK